MKKKLIYAVVALLACSSCGSDYLDTVPQSQTATATIFSTTDNAKLAVNGICRLMVHQYLGTQGMNGEGTINNWYGNYPGNDTQKCALTGWSNTINGNYHENSSSQYDYYPWFYYYKLIVNANAIIVYIDDAEGSEEDKQFIKAQGLTFRAYSYFMLSQLFCKRWVDSSNGSSRGLPLRLELTNDDLAASTLGEVYAQVYADLDEAISLFTQSGQDRPSGDNYSPNLDVAYAIYARAALTREDWSTAAKYAPLARASYPLMSNDEYVDGGFNTTNKEWIWSCYNDGNQDLFYYGFFAYMASNSSASNCRTYPFAISKELYDQIPETDVRRTMFLAPQTEEEATSFNSSDNNSGAVTSGGALYQRAHSDYENKLYETSTLYAYMQFKFQCVAQSGIGEINNFRSAEMYLTEAEADCHLGKDSEAQALLVELNKTSGRNPEYTCTKTGDDLLTEVKLYRRIDLWGEGFDWFDHKRWNSTLARHTWSEGGSFHSTFAITVEPSGVNAWTWVYPDREIDYNGLLENARE